MPLARAGLYFSHPACLEHDPRVHMPEHPDTPERLLAIERALVSADWLGWERREAPPAGESQLALIHGARHIDQIKQLALAGGGAIDGDTFVGEPSYRAALHGAGGACEMTRALTTSGTTGRCGSCARGALGHARVVFRVEQTADFGCSCLSCPRMCGHGEKPVCSASCDP